MKTSVVCFFLVVLTGLLIALDINSAPASSPTPVATVPVRPSLTPSPTHTIEEMLREEQRNYMRSRWQGLSAGQQENVCERFWTSPEILYGSLRALDRFVFWRVYLEFFDDVCGPTPWERA